MQELTPRIYVACLAAYNSGQLHGAWIDADQSADAIHDEIRAICATFKAFPAFDPCSNLNICQLAHLAPGIRICSCTHFSQLKTIGVHNWVHTNNALF